MTHSRLPGQPLAVIHHTPHVLSTHVPPQAGGAPASLPRPADRLVSTRQAAQMLGLSVENMRYLADEGRINVVRGPGGPRWFRVSEVRRLGTNIQRRRREGLLPTPRHTGTHRGQR